MGLYIAGDTYKLSNIQQLIDYYGNKEDIAVYRVKKCRVQDVKSAFCEVEQIETPIKAIIEAITLINEHQELYFKEKKLYDVWLTRGIIFHAAGREILFLKDVVPFSEEIFIKKGYDLEKEAAINEDFSDGWDDEKDARVSYEIKNYNLN